MTTRSKTILQKKARENLAMLEMRCYGFTWAFCGRLFFVDASGARSRVLRYIDGTPRARNMQRIRILGRYRRGHN